MFDNPIEILAGQDIFARVELYPNGGTVKHTLLSRASVDQVSVYFVLKGFGFEDKELAFKEDLGGIKKTTGGAFTAWGTGTEYVFPHSFTSEPDWYSAYLICTVAIQGYEIGDKVFLNQQQYIAVGNIGFTIYADSTNVTVKMVDQPNPIRIFRADNGGSMTPTDANFDLYVDAYKGGSISLNTNGWGFYADDASSDLVVTTSDTKLLINGLGGNTNEVYLPEGNTSIWDVATSKMTPFTVGASYDVRIQLDVTALNANPTQINFKLDIGGGVTPTIVIMEQTVTLKNNVPQSIVISTPIFCLDTFVANGGQIFMSTNTGTLTIENRTILLVRTS